MICDDLHKHVLSTKSIRGIEKHEEIMAESSVCCTFHHVSPDVAKIIKFTFAINSSVKEKEKEISCSCAREKVEEIRLQLADVFSQHPYVWLSIDYPRRAISNHLEKSLGQIDHLFFGALLSTEKFLIHQTHFTNQNQWNGKIDLRKQNLLLQCQENDRTICLSFPLKCLQRDILIIDGEDYSEIIVSFNFFTVESRRNGLTKGERLYGIDPIVQSLNPCSDLLICISPKSKANEFLDYLRHVERFRMFYTLLAIQPSNNRWSSDLYDCYQTHDGRYSLAMLHSLGFLFDDKYFSNPDLQNVMIDLAKEDDLRFYHLAKRALNELNECHWFDLTKIFNRDQWKRVSTFERPVEKRSISVSVVHLTPQRLTILPKEESKGHRLLRHRSFSNPNDFCLVYLKPDLADAYFNHPNILNFFREHFQSGIELIDSRYHLFGLSNSQKKQKSFWFYKATSPREIHQKRQELGQLDQIFNLGTYVARLGLWFSSTDPTGIELRFCADRDEFEKRLQRREICVTIIDDIERNDFCFTDGNGLVSKGLANLIAERLFRQPKNSQLVPSAYQIRLAGCKGLIITDPNSTLDQFYIKIRPSMKKFECDHWFLDICDYSRAMSTRLNNQIIWLLSDLGVSDETFYRLQRKWFEKKPQPQKCNESLKKNQIPLPPNECRYMFGCSLQSKLEEGQCFIRYQLLDQYGNKLSKPEFKCVRGHVIVTKNPCPYAGDMIKLWAVDLPELYDLTDVIVFSTEGERPDFHKIAGSDLDGDGYFVYWGEELRLKRLVDPLDYTPDKKLTQSTAISADDVINYCISSLNGGSEGEIYNLHAVIVDKNYEKSSFRTCQPLAKELARMFSSAIDSAKTGYVIDRQRLKEIRENFAKEYPDFLENRYAKTYKSNSIVGRLYRNARLYIEGKTSELNALFDKLNINENSNDVSTRSSSSSIGRPLASSTPLNRSFQIHPGSPSSVLSNSNTIIADPILIPPQLVLIDGMFSSNPLIRFSHSNKPFYSSHKDLIRYRLKLFSIDSDRCRNSPSLNSLFFDQINSSILNENSAKFVASFGHFYLLKYSKNHDDFPTPLESLSKEKFLPPLFDTFFPSTILERIEINEENVDCCQQIFYKSNHQIKREFIENDGETISLVFPWLKMNLIEHRREIILICFDCERQTEICFHFDKNGRIQFIEDSPKIHFKSFHQQISPQRSDILYEFRSSSLISDEQREKFLKNEILLDPTRPSTLPLHENLLPMISFSQIRNIFQYGQIQVHILRYYSPIHYKNDRFYSVRCSSGYFEERDQQHSVEIHYQYEQFDRNQLRSLMALAGELSEMLD